MKHINIINCGLVLATMGILICIAGIVIHFTSKDEVSKVPDITTTECICEDKNNIKQDNSCEDVRKRLITCEGAIEAALKEINIIIEKTK